MKVKFDEYHNSIDVTFSNSERGFPGGADVIDNGFWVAPWKAKELVKKLQREIDKSKESK